MNTEQARQRLLEKQQDLIAEITRLESEARESRSAEVEDPIDRVTSSESKAGGFEVSTLAANTLAQVREALQRIEQGTYGTCVICGRSIEAARLEAVPWTPYCLQDQQKQDRAAQTTASGF